MGETTTNIMASRCVLYACLLLLTYSIVEAAINKCPGEGLRYGDYKCNHDGTHRVCARLKSASGSKMMWGDGDFWQITGQPDWSSQVGSDKRNPGGDWCICMWATARLISQVGCENVHIDCSATDISYVMSKYTDGGTDLAPAKQCLQKKCGAVTSASAAADAANSQGEVKELGRV